MHSDVVPVRATAAEPKPHRVEPVPLAERSRWGAKLATNQFVTSVEIVPPRGVDATRMLTDVAKLKAANVDAVNVHDGPRAQSRMGALLTSVLIEPKVGIETVTLARGDVFTGKYLSIECWTPRQIRHPFPVIFVHGGTSQGLDWMTTPDGRRRRG